MTAVPVYGNARRPGSDSDSHRLNMKRITLLKVLEKIISPNLTMIMIWRISITSAECGVTQRKDASIRNLLVLCAAEGRWGYGGVLRRHCVPTEFTILQMIP
jgi:hypothetical protein